RELLVHGDGFDRKAILRIGFAYLLEVLGSLFVVADPGAEIADRVQDGQILGVLFDDLFILGDGILQLALVDILLRRCRYLCFVKAETGRHRYKGLVLTIAGENENYSSL